MSFAYDLSPAIYNTQEEQLKLNNPGEDNELSSSQMKLYVEYMKQCQWRDIIINNIKEFGADSIWQKIKDLDRYENPHIWRNVD